MIEKKCQYCESLFLTENRKSKNHGTFCSNKCHQRSRRNKIKINCAFCKTEFLAQNAAFKKGQARFCSRVCASTSSRGEKISRICRQCKSKFLSNPYRVNHGKALYCSLKCKREFNKLSSIELFNLNTTRMDNGCLEYRAKHGYGRVYIGNNKHQLAHRFIWEINFGKIPKGLFVCHKCDNPPCCEITHLFLGTPADNTRDMLAKGREWNKKLSYIDVVSIKNKLKMGNNIDLLASEYNVSRCTIKKIKDNKTWKQVIIK